MRALAIFCFLILSWPAFGQTDSLLRTLEKVIKDRKDYEQIRQDRISEIREKLETLPAGKLDDQFRLYVVLCNLYKSYSFDSAFTNIRRLQTVAYASRDSVKITYARNQLGFVLLSSGMFKETLDSLGSVIVSGMPDTIRTDYYLVMSRVYYDLAEFDRDKYYANHYREMGNRYTDSVLSITSPGSYHYLASRAMMSLINGNPQQAYLDLSTVLERKELTTHQIAMISSNLADYFASIGKADQAIPLYARAAIEDIRDATKETLAILRLSELLYQKGDIAHAYDFVQQAMDDANFYGARQRKVQVGAVLPVIAAAKLNNVEEQRRVWLIYSSVITALTLTVIAFAIISLRQLKKVKAAEKALLESNRIKEEYIGYYFTISSDYVSKIEAFKRTVEMKLLTKKIDEIRPAVETLNIKKERDDLYTNFDRIFLKLFPDFVTVFNSYFSEENKIVLKEGQLLNTELRIFALIRMGIHDNEKIARILDISINTIYNYKARTKSRSLIPNEDFEKAIMKIHPQ